MTLPSSGRRIIAFVARLALPAPSTTNAPVSPSRTPSTPPSPPAPSTPPIAATTERAAHVALAEPTPRRRAGRDVRDVRAVRAVLAVAAPNATSWKRWRRRGARHRVDGRCAIVAGLTLAVLDELAAVSPTGDSWYALTASGRWVIVPMECR